jgi:hypothetical protein
MSLATAAHDRCHTHTHTHCHKLSHAISSPDYTAERQTTTYPRGWHLNRRVSLYSHAREQQQEHREQGRMAHFPSCHNEQRNHHARHIDISLYDHGSGDGRCAGAALRNQAIQRMSDLW